MRPALMSAMISVIGASALMLCPLCAFLLALLRGMGVGAGAQACAASSFFHSSMRST